MADMDLLVLPFYLVTAHNILFFVMLLSLGILATALTSKRGPGKSAKPLLCLVVLSFANLFAGTWISGLLVHAFGLTGQATIVDSYATSSVYNNQRVRGYKVLMKTATGKMVETSFLTSDFNVYPHHNMTVYPTVGDHFNVQYLPHMPSAFIILGNDDSPWASRLACDRLEGAYQTADARLQFDRTNAGFRDDAAAKLKTLLNASGCVPNPDVRQEFENELRELQKPH